MKTRIKAYLIASLFVVSAMFCSSCCGMIVEEENLVVCIFKYSQGEDYSEYLLVSSKTEEGSYEHEGYKMSKPIAVNGGFYIYNLAIGDEFADGELVCLSITVDDFNNGRAPEGWQAHWRDYLLSDSPLSACYEIWGTECSGYNDFPAYNKKCTSTFGIDTVILNRMIDDGTLFDYVTNFY